VSGPVPPQYSRGWSSRDIVRAAFIVAGVVVALRFVWAARSVFVLGFLGVLFGITLSAGVTWLHRRGVPRGIGALVLVLAVLGIFVGLGVIVAPRITEQWQELQHQLPDALSQVEGWVRERQGGVAKLLESPDQVAKAPKPESIRQTVAQQVSKLGANFFAVFSSTLAVLGAIIIVTFISVFIAVDPRTYRRGIMHLIPHQHRRKAGELLDAMGASLRRWLVAQSIGMLVIGSVSTVALLLLDVRAAVALGIIAGILEAVPYFGPILSAVPAMAMAFLDGPEKALWVALAYIAIQQVESNLLMPLLMQEGLDLPPVLTILSQAALSIVFGFVGLLIAVPLLGAVMVPIKLLYVQDVVGDDVPLPGEDSG
jgi:predicted PurR-regulated permease PerM